MRRPLAILISAALGLAVVAAVAQTVTSSRPAATAAKTAGTKATAGRAPAAIARPPAAIARPAAATGDAAIRAAVLKAVPGSTVDSIKPSQIPGYKEVAISGRVVYVSNNGEYLIQGTLIDLETRDSLTAASEAVLRRDVLNAVPSNRRIIFAPPNPRHRLTVFTDIDCGYCRKMHKEIAAYNKAGIAVEYLFFPRAGIGSESFNKAVSVWCAPDRRKALTDAKADRKVAKKTCPNPVSMDYELGRRVGVDGTPAIYAQDGTQLGGYLPPAEMLVRLERQASKTVATQ